MCTGSVCEINILLGKVRIPHPPQSEKPGHFFCIIQSMQMGKKQCDLEVSDFQFKWINRETHPKTEDALVEVFSFNSCFL